MNDTESANREAWPGVDRAYDFVLPTYQLLVSRFESADNRIQSILTFAGSVALGIPVFAKAGRSTMSLDSPWLFGATLLFVFIAILGVVGRAYGGLRLVDPLILYQKWLHRSDWAFKKDMIWFAGEDFAANAEAIRLKGNCALAMAILFAIMVCLLLGWLMTSGL